MSGRYPCIYYKLKLTLQSAFFDILESNFDFRLLHSTDIQASLDNKSTSVICCIYTQYEIRGM